MSIRLAARRRFRQRTKTFHLRRFRALRDGPLVSGNESMG